MPAPCAVALTVRSAWNELAPTTRYLARVMSSRRDTCALHGRMSGLMLASPSLQTDRRVGRCARSCAILRIARDRADMADPLDRT
jgi:hypothetical protein